MSTLLPVHDISEVDCLLSPRFAVEQAKPDGSMKLRAVDNFSWAARWEADGGAAARPSKKELKEMSVNGHVLPKEKLKPDTLDELIATMSMFVAIVGSIPALWKADIDAAFRRIAVRPAHRWTCGVAFVVNGLVRGTPPCYAPPPMCAPAWQVHQSVHAACPFGAVASVHAWERVGAAIAHIARK